MDSQNILLAGFAACFFFEKKPAINVNFVNDGQFTFLLIAIIFLYICNTPHASFMLRATEKSIISLSRFCLKTILYL